MTESSLQSVSDIAREARAQMPPGAGFSDQDQAVLTRHSDLLVSFGPKIVETFYQTVFSHPPTEAVFKEGERPHREKSLHDWWVTSMTKPCDDDYFGWMAMVGLVHVVREVSNPMMLAMAGVITDVVEHGVATSDLPETEAEEIRTAINRLLSTVSAVITYGYDLAVETALYDVAGMPQGLLRRLRNQSVQTSLTKARVELDR